MSICEGLSAKFEKELTSFIAWLPSTEYNVSDVANGSKVDWKDVVLSSFQEPGRNKLETFIKELMKVYFLHENGVEITDVKLIAKQFREAPKESKKVPKESKKVPKETKKAPKESKKEKVTEKESKKEKVTEKESKKEKVTEKESKKEKVTENTLDKSEECFMRALLYCSKKLAKCFGNNMDDEWKLMIGSKGFSIGNLINEDDFEGNEWYLASFEKRSQKEKDLLSYMDNFIKNKDIENVIEENVIEENVIEENVIEENVIEENGDDIDNLIDKIDTIHMEDKIDIELDLIDDDVDINIDDIDFDF